MVVSGTRADVLFACLACAVVLAPGCRGVDGGASQDARKASRPRAVTDREWYGGRKQGEKAVDPSEVLDQVLRGPTRRYDIVIQPEDTLDLLSRWTGRSVKELLRLNPEVKSRGLRAGEGFRLALTEGEFSRFNGLRNAYLAKRRVRRGKVLEIVDVVEHRVRRGEDLAAIMQRYSTSLELLEKLNPSIHLTGIEPGQVLRVPILGGNERDKPSMPGPKPPAPLPVPTPPEQPRPITVHKDRGIKPDPLPEYYVVRKGDTAWELASKRLGVSLKALGEANPGIDLERLRPGMRLKIPSGSGLADVSGSKPR